MPRRQGLSWLWGGVRGLGAHPGCRGRGVGSCCASGAFLGTRGPASLGLEQHVCAWAQTARSQPSEADTPRPHQQRPFPGSVNGDVRFFDPRMPESVNVLQIVKGLTALDIHPQANLIAW